MATKTKQSTQNWKKREPGDEVVVIDTHNQETPGIVDAKTACSDVIWIVDYKGRGRRAFDHGRYQRPAHVTYRPVIGASASGSEGTPGALRSHPIASYPSSCEL